MIYASQETTMQLHEVVGDYDRYFDFTKIKPDMYAEIMTALERQDAVSLSPQEREMMYHPERAREELEVKKLRLELTKLEAEVKHLEAEAERDRAAARRGR